MLKTKVYVEGLVQLEDARYCAGMGVDQLGFALGKGKVSLQEFEEIAQWIVGPKWVLEISDDVHHSTFSEVIQLPAIAAIQLRVHQIDILSSLSTSQSIVLVVQGNEWENIKTRLADIPVAQVIFHESVIGSHLSWDEIKAINFKIPVLVNGLSPETNFDAFLKNPISGVALTACGAEGGNKEELYNTLESLSIDY